MNQVCGVPQSGMIVPSACLSSSVLESKHRYNFFDAMRKNVEMIRAPATNVPRNVPETLETPPLRQR